MKRKTSLMLAIAMILPGILLASTPASAGPFSDYDLDDTVVAAGDYHAVDLGNLEPGKEISVTFITDEYIDGLLMTDTQYQSWANGGTDLIRAGSALDQDIEIYTYTVETADHYWYVLDNSDQNAGGATGTSEATVSSGGINIGDRLTNGISTRIMLNPGSTYSYDLESVSGSDLIDLSISCEDWLYDDIDVFVVNGENKATFESGASTWNRNASYLDSCFEMWNYEVESSDSWAVYLENGPRGDASQSDDSIQIDIDIGTRSLLPSEVTSNTRMIEDGDAWRVDLGSLSAGDTLTFALTLDGLFDELDILIMESAEADKFLAGESAEVLGHPSMIDVNFFDMWDYRFPESGAYSLLLDNSAEPQGGADNGAAIHGEISVIETTLLSEWLGWYQSRHFVPDGGYVSFDIGELDVGDSFGYTVSGHSHGSGFMNTFDVLVFTDTEYQVYTAGGDAIYVENYTSLDEWLSLLNSFEAEEAGHYWVVIDAADGPSGGADASGAWTFDFTIRSDVSVSCPAAQDGNYKMSATNEGSNAPTPPDDGSTGGGSNGGTGGGTDDGTDDTPDLPDIGDSKSDEEQTPGFTSLMALGVIGLVALIRRRESQ